MAKPRIFISSTFFDLRSMRASLERFIKEIGYDPVLFERGHITWDKEISLETSCYREINSCDILIAIIGGKFGSQSKNNQSSITQNEIKESFEKGKQVYIFIDKSVHSEYQTYQKNKHLEGFIPISVDNVKIFDFVSEMYNINVGNPIEPFETVEDIIRYLREQWAGLFQRLLATNSRKIESQFISDIKNSSETLRSLVDVLIKTKEKESPDQVRDILMMNNPAFGAIKKAAGISYRVIFYNLDELSELLLARGYQLAENFFDEEFYDFNNYKNKKGIRVKSSIFDDNILKVLTPSEWDNNNVKVISLEGSHDNNDNDMPF